MSKLNYVHVLSESTNGFYHIKFTNEQYSDIIIKFGEISFDDQGDECIMHFDYDIIKNPNNIDINDDFKQYIGDVILEMIQQQLENNEVIYTGGIDDNRINDIEQLDSQ